MRRYQPKLRWLSLAILFVSLLSWVMVQPINAATPTDLYFSEYVEGSSLNKAIEIYNGTGSAIDLAADNYEILVYFNGSTSPGTTIDLNGTIADGDVFVVADDGALLGIAPDQTTNSSLWNGDDAIELTKSGAVVDSFGRVGEDPGSQWSANGVGTQNQTLRRNADVCAGDTNSTDAFDPSAEWTEFAQDTFDDLGTYTANCSGSSVAPDVVINEIRIDSFETGDDEFFELAGTAGQALDGLTYIVIGDGTGGSGVIESVTDLTGFSIQADGYFAGAESTFTQSGADDTSLTLNFENSDNVTHLLVWNFTGANGDDLDTNDDGTLDTAPWDSVVSSVALIETTDGSGDEVYSSNQVGPDGTFVPGHVYLCPDADATGSYEIGTFTPVGDTDTPGTTNSTCQPPIASAVKIHEIQGNSSNQLAGGAHDDVSPRDGDLVSIEGVVTGVYPIEQGFYMQEQDNEIDADSSTSEGIFVYYGSFAVPTLNEGDLVTVDGTVDEFFGQTQIDTVTNVTVDATGQLGLVSTTAIDMETNLVNAAADRDDFWEQYEGMLVQISNTLTVANFNGGDGDLPRYGTVHMTVGRIQQYTQSDSTLTAAEYTAFVEDYERRTILLDDGNDEQNVTQPGNTLADQPLYHPVANGGFGAGTQGTDFFRTGDTVNNMTGVLRWSWSGSGGTDNWRIYPTVANPVSFTTTNPRPTTPPIVNGNIKVVSFNVLNYFQTIDITSSTTSGDCSPSETLDCRGADATDERDEQLQKMALALQALDADVYGLIELENSVAANPANDGADPVLEAIVNELNGLVGAGTYGFIDAGAIGADAIKQAFIYKTTVLQVNGYAVLDTSAFVDPNNIGDKNRPALLATFEVIDTNNPDDGEIFNVVVNHLKSKGSSCGAGDDDTTTGQGNCNDTRDKAAQALATWLATDPTSSGDSDILIIGDLNSYYYEDPMQTLRSENYTSINTADDYGYVFDGQIGSLDHALASSSLLPFVTGYADWHINTDEMDWFDYNNYDKETGESSFEEKSSGKTVVDYTNSDVYRASDHDPLIVGLTLSTGVGVDVNGDGLVTPEDVIYVINRLNPGIDLTADVDGDGDVDLDDVNDVINALGTVAPL